MGGILSSAVFGRFRGRRPDPEPSSSPPPPPPRPFPLFTSHMNGIWTPLGPFLDGNGLLAMANLDPDLYETITDGSSDYAWKNAFLRELEVEDPGVPLYTGYGWVWVYCSAFGCLDGHRHSYELRDPDLEIMDYKRIGGFMIQSDVAYLTTILTTPPPPPAIDQDIAEQLQTHGSCWLRNVQNGIWIADAFGLPCNCTNEDCYEGMMMLEVRHVELFLEQEFRDGIWAYDHIGTKIVNVVPVEPDNPAVAFAAIGDSEKMPEQPLFTLAAWAGGDPEEEFTRVSILLA